MEVNARGYESDGSTETPVLAVQRRATTGGRNFSVPYPYAVQKRHGTRQKVAELPIERPRIRWHGHCSTTDEC
jgi:hypothetical protein